MSPAGYSLAVLSSNRLRFTDRLQSWIKSTVTSSENCTHSHCTWLPGSRLTRRYWLRFYAPPDISINDAGVITGQYRKANGRNFGFVRHPNGKFTSFDPGFNTQPTSINNKGASTGSYQDIDLTHFHGFVRSPDGTITLFDDASFCTSGPTSINDQGVITASCAASGPFNILWMRFP